MGVRREAVRLELIDAGFSTGMARAAVAAGLVDRQLINLDGRHIDLRRSTDGSIQGIDHFRRTVDQSGPAIDRFSGRMALMAKAGLVLGPSLIPITAVGIPAVTGLASALGFAAIGMGTLVAASQGVGDALQAVNEAAIEPTSANLEKAREAMAKLAPETQAFVTRFQELRPVLTDIRDAAAAGWFPGLTESLDDFERMGPRIADVFQIIGDTGGRLVAEGVDALAGPEWAEFITFVENEGPDALEDLGRSVGNLARGMAELWMAFSPLSNEFSVSLLRASRSFAEWADGVSSTDGFRELLDYIEESGPQVEDTLTAIAGAAVAIVKAAAPLGGPVLAGFEVIADTLRLIADSPVGSKIVTMAAAFVVLNKTLAVTAALLAKAGFIGASGAIRGAAPGGAGGPIGGGIVPLTSRVGATRATFAQFRQDLATVRGATLAQARASTTVAQAQARVNATMRQYGATAAKTGAGVGAFAVATGALGEGLGLQNTAMLGLVGSMATTGPWGAAIGAGIGLVADFTKANDNLEAALRSAGDALDSMDPQELVDALASVNAQMDKFADWGKSDNFSDWLGDNATMERQASIVDEIGASLGLWESGAEKAAKEQEKLGKAVEDTASQAAAAQSKADILARNDSIREWAYTTGSAFIDLASDIKKPVTSLDDLTRRMREQGMAARDMGKNLRTALRNGADPTALQELIDTLGPEAGRALRQLARGGQAAADDFNAAWAVSVRGLRTVEGAIMAVGTQIGRLPDGTVIRVDAEIQRAQARIRAIHQEALTVAGDYRVNFIVTQTNRINKPKVGPIGGSQDYDTGGYTGVGGKYELAGRVHREEVVIPKEDVERDRAFLVDRYGHLPGMDQLRARVSTPAIPSVKVSPAAIAKARTQTSSIVRHRVDVHVTGEMDLEHAKAQLRGVVADEIDQDKTWSRTQ